MELPLGNPYKEILQQKFEGKITQAQMDTEIAKDIANKPNILAYELLPPKPQSLVNYYNLSHEEKREVWRELQYHPDIQKYNRILLDHKRNIFWLKYYIDCLIGFPDLQTNLRDRLAHYETQHTIEDENVAKQWGGSIVD